MSKANRSRARADIHAGIKATSGYNNKPWMIFEAVRQQLVELAAHNRVKTKPVHPKSQLLNCWQG